MVFSISYCFGFTDKTRQKLGELSVPTIPLPSDLQLAPAVGDLVRIFGIESHTFVVRGREFSYLESNKINITYLLDLADDKRWPPELRRIK